MLVKVKSEVEIGEFMEKEKELNYATDQECKERRQKLIDAGIITPGKLEKKYNELYEPAPKTNRVVSITSVPEEGVYKRHSIKNDEDYKATRASYLYTLQSLFKVRKELNLKFEKRK